MLPGRVEFGEGRTAWIRLKHLDGLFEGHSHGKPGPGTCLRRTRALMNAARSWIEYPPFVQPTRCRGGATAGDMRALPLSSGERACLVQQARVVTPASVDERREDRLATSVSSCRGSSWSRGCPPLMVAYEIAIYDLVGLEPERNDSSHGAPPERWPRSARPRRGPRYGDHPVGTCGALSEPVNKLDSQFSWMKDERWFSYCCSSVRRKNSVRRRSRYGLSPIPCPAPGTGTNSNCFPALTSALTT